MAEEIKFEVGGKYENMKGVFEVIAMRKDSMDIRWEDGEVIDTPIALQKRIIERMQFDKEMEKARKDLKEKKAKTSASKGGKQFSGLEEADFTNSVSKTTWRGRGQLGGAVATRVKSRQFKFNSWAVLRKPEVNWLDVARQKQDDLKYQVKFYARVKEGNFFYGIHVPSPDPAQAAEGDWNIFVDWVSKPENDSWLAKQCNANRLYLSDLSKQGFSGTMQIKEDQWVHADGDERETNVDFLHAFLNQAGQTGAMELRIEKQMDKDTTIERGREIAADVADLFGSLMPLYVAIATKNS